MTPVSLSLHRFAAFFLRAVSTLLTLASVYSEAPHQLSCPTRWEHASDRNHQSGRFSPCRSCMDLAALIAPISMLAFVRAQSRRSHGAGKIRRPDGSCCICCQGDGSTTTGAFCRWPLASHAGTPTGAMRRAYVRRFPTIAPMNESSRVSVWTLTLPSFSLHANSSTYRNRCLADA